MAQVNIRMDEDLKEKADKLFNSLGMNFTTAINIFVTQAVREGGIPFDITTRTKTADPFFSESNMRVLRKSIKEANEGKFITKTMDELRAMEK